MDIEFDMQEPSLKGEAIDADNGAVFSHPKLILKYLERVGKEYQFKKKYNGEGSILLGLTDWAKTKRMHSYTCHEAV